MVYCHFPACYLSWEACKAETYAVYSIVYQFLRVLFLSIWNNTGHPSFDRKNLISMHEPYSAQRARDSLLKIEFSSFIILNFRNWTNLLKFLIFTKIHQAQNNCLYNMFDFYTNKGAHFRFTSKSTLTYTC